MTLRGCLRPSLGVLVVAAALAATVPAPAVFAQSSEVSALRDDIERLQRDLRDLRRQMEAGGGRRAPRAIGSGEVPPTLAASMEVRLSQLEGQMRRMTGRFEEMNHAIRQVQDKLDKVVSDLELRIAALERGKPITGGGPAKPPRMAETPPPRSAPPPPREREGRAAGPGAPSAPPREETEIAKLPEGKPAEQYSYAMSFLHRGEHAKAAAALRAFIKAHPDGALTGNAIYWLGESYYVRGRYADAAIQFAEGFKKFPKSAKAPDNLLKLGMSFGKLGKRAEACASLSALRERYPRAPGYISRAVVREQRRLRCG